MDAPRQIQQAERPPAQPSYILRGHKAQVHALHFLRGNSRLLSGDADGVIILWDIAVKRPRAVWRSHAGAILGLGIWGSDKVISHGRDGKLNVWQLRASDENDLATALPVDETTMENWKQPWLLHSLQVHTLNFCAFAMCLGDNGESALVATPAANEGFAIIHELPSEEPKYLVPPAERGKTGMVMALQIIRLDGCLFLVTGYESGLTSTQCYRRDSNDWATISVCQPHTQPILSLDVVPRSDVYFTSGADAVVAMASLKADDKKPLKINETKHAGQQGLVVRSDGKIFATAGWDGRMRVYSAKTLKELAVLKWHKEGCYTVAFAEIQSPDASANNTVTDEEQFGSSVEIATPKRQVQQGMGNQSDTHELTTARQRRVEATRRTHWLAAGSKDGKVSLWDIF